MHGHVCNLWMEFQCQFSFVLSLSAEMTDPCSYLSDLMDLSLMHCKENSYTFTLYVYLHTHTHTHTHTHIYTFL